MNPLRVGIEEGRFEFEFVNVRGSTVRLNINSIFITMCYRQMLLRHETHYQYLFCCSASMKGGNPCNL